MFPGCSFNLPSRTGPTGASACMINSAEQDSQSGTNSGFYRSRRYRPPLC